MLGLIAWGAVAVIIVVGLLRGTPVQELLLLGTAMAISAIPTGLPAFVSGLLSMGAKQLAEAKAVVKNLTDVETLGATSAINTDKTGTLTLNEMMVSTLYVGGTWFHVDGEGYRKSGAITVGGRDARARTSAGWRWGSRLDTDAVVGDDGSVIGDPTEAALVVLAAKIGVDVVETRRAYPAAGRGAVRLRLQVHGHVPPDSGGRSRAPGRAGQGRPGRGPGAVHSCPADR